MQRSTRYQVTQYISHGISSNQTSPERKGGDDARLGIASDTPPGLMAQVLLLNDDYTPMEFVVHVLERVFDKDRETATRIMLDVHHQGSGSCGIYPHDAADAMVKEVLDFARKHQHPLRCVLK